ncbi:hypothetical protein PCE1_004438 [Barthelona sp. PCE]
MRRIITPINVLQLTNVAIVKLRVKKTSFEVACYKSKMKAYLEGIETDINEVLQVLTIFTMASKGKQASTQQLQKAFPGLTKDEIIEYILRNGEYQQSKKERDVSTTNLLNQVISIIVEKCYNADLNVPFTADMVKVMLKQVGFRVTTKESAKRQALWAIDTFQRKSSELGISIGRGMMHLRIIGVGTQALKALKAFWKDMDVMIIKEETNEEGAFLYEIYCGSGDFYVFKGWDHFAVYEIEIVNANVNVQGRNSNRGKEEKFTAPFITDVEPGIRELGNFFSGFESCKVRSFEDDIAEDSKYSLIGYDGRYNVLKAIFHKNAIHAICAIDGEEGIWSVKYALVADGLKEISVRQISIRDDYIPESLKMSSKMALISFGEAGAASGCVVPLYDVGFHHIDLYCDFVDVCPRTGYIAIAEGGHSGTFSIFTRTLEPLIDKTVENVKALAFANFHLYLFKEDGVQVYHTPNPALGLPLREIDFIPHVFEGEIIVECINNLLVVKNQGFGYTLDGLLFIKHNEFNRSMIPTSPFEFVSVPDHVLDSKNFFSSPYVLSYGSHGIRAYLAFTGQVLSHIPVADHVTYIKEQNQLYYSMGGTAVIYNTETDELDVNAVELGEQEMMGYVFPSICNPEEVYCQLIGEDENIYSFLTEETRRGALDEMCMCPVFFNDEDFTFLFEEGEETMPNPQNFDLQKSKICEGDFFQYNPETGIITRFCGSDDLTLTYSTRTNLKFVSAQDSSSLFYDPEHNKIIVYSSEEDELYEFPELDFEPTIVQWKVNKVIFSSLDRTIIYEINISKNGRLLSKKLPKGRYLRDFVPTTDYFGVYIRYDHSNFVYNITNMWQSDEGYIGEALIKLERVVEEPEPEPAPKKKKKKKKKKKTDTR